MPVLLRQTAPWFLAALTICLSLLFPQPAVALAPWIFLSSALILGVPHGACDPWVPGWVLRRPSRLSFLFSFSLIYLAISATYLILWRFYPLPSTVFFLLLTAWHWGTADASLELAPSLRWLLFALGRGSLVLLAPFAFHLHATWSVILLLAPEAGLPPSTFPFLPTLFFALALNLLSRPSLHQTIETLLLLLLFYLTPPLLSVGTYFVAFHAWRHLLRLSAFRDLRTGLDPICSWTQSLLFLLLLSIPLTLASLAFLIWIPPLLHLSPTGSSWVGPYLILLAVLTLPHALLIAWSDQRQKKDKIFIP